MMQKWVRIPGPGQFRGEGKWMKLEEAFKEPEEAWKDLTKTGFLPTHEGDEPPETISLEK
jgi:hypothetical protein